MANNMTFRYKQMAMKWLTGKMNIVPKVNNVLFEEFTSNENKLETLMNGLYFPFGYDIKGVVQGKTTDNDNIEYSVLYGDYQDEQQNKLYGFIMILDQEYNAKQIIKQYSNGEYFGDIISLNVGNDGRFYMVEQDNNDYYRFVLLNNILVKSPSEENYQVVQRQTYRFPQQSQFSADKMLMIKHPQEARYLMAQYNSIDRVVYCTEFIINVGSTNEWNYYNKAVLSGQYDTELSDLLASWDSENHLTFMLVASYYNQNNVYTSVYYKTETGNTLEVNSSSVQDSIASSSDIVNTQAVIKNFNTIYYSIGYNISGSLYYSLYIVYIDDNFNIDSINRRFFEVEDPVSNNKGITLMKKDEDIFFFYVDLTGFVGIVIGDVVYQAYVSGIDFSGSLYLANMQRQFNLYIMYVQVGDNVYINKMVYIDKDNNSSYQDLTSMNPYFAKLYDDNSKLIFARTLYNKSVNGQTTTSTIQVPNQFINNVNIGGQKLFGQTYLNLINQPDTYTKNEYEEVYFNFANTWYIQNQNDPNNVILNPSGATRFNQSISQTNDFANCKCTKYRLNYSDGTTKVAEIDPSQIVLEDNDEPFKYTYYIMVFNPTDKNILSIDLISEDETTIFQTINNLNFASDKLYSLTQDVYVL